MKYTNVQSENEEKIKDIWSKMDFSTLTKADEVDLKKLKVCYHSEIMSFQEVSFI